MRDKREEQGTGDADADTRVPDQDRPRSCFRNAYLIVGSPRAGWLDGWIHQSTLSTHEELDPLPHLRSRSPRDATLHCEHGMHGCPRPRVGVGVSLSSVDGLAPDHHSTIRTAQLYRTINFLLGNIDDPNLEAARRSGTRPDEYTLPFIAHDTTRPHPRPRPSGRSPLVSHRMIHIASHRMHVRSHARSFISMQLSAEAKHKQKRNERACHGMACCAARSEEPRCRALPAWGTGIDGHGGSMVPGEKWRWRTNGM